MFIARSDSQRVPFLVQNLRVYEGPWVMAKDTMVLQHNIAHILQIHIYIYIMYIIDYNCIYIYIYIHMVTFYIILTYPTM